MHFVLLQWNKCRPAAGCKSAHCACRAAQCAKSMRSEPKVNERTLVPAHKPERKHTPLTHTTTDSPALYSSSPLFWASSATTRLPADVHHNDRNHFYFTSYTSIAACTPCELVATGAPCFPFNRVLCDAILVVQYTP